MDSWTIENADNAESFLRDAATHQSNSSDIRVVRKDATKIGVVWGDLVIGAMKGKTACALSRGMADALRAAGADVVWVMRRMSFAEWMELKE